MAPARRMHPGLLPEYIGEVGTQGARRPLPPGCGRLGSQSRTVTEQLKDGDTADTRTRQMLLQRVVEIQQTLVAQPQDQHCGEGLGEGSDPELRIGVR